MILAAKARADDIRMHFKNTMETANAVSGKNLLKAIEYLENVIEHKAIVPFRVHNGGIGRKGLCRQIGFTNGRFPEKSCRYLIALLKNLKSNAEHRQLDPEQCTITHAACQKAV